MAFLTGSLNKVFQSLLSRLPGWLLIEKNKGVYFLDLHQMALKEEKKP